MKNLPTIGSPVVGEPTSIPARRSWVAVLAAALLMVPGIADANLVDLKYVSKSGEFLAKCSPEAKEARFSVQGPGVLHVKYILEPYRSGIWTLHIPISWTLYKADGSHSGWDRHFPNLGHYENGGLPYKITQAGKPVKGGKYIDGLPLESESSALVSKNKYVIGVRLGGTCAKQGHTWTQWGQVNRLTVSFSPGAPGTTKPKTGTPGAGKSDGTASPSSKPDKNKKESTKSASSPARNLAGRWVHSADRNAKEPYSVFLKQKDSNVTMTHRVKYKDKWVTYVCKGPLSGNQLHMQCKYTENPYHFAHFDLHLRLSSDGNHLDGALRSHAGGEQESHYSRVP